MLTTCNKLFIRIKDFSFSIDLKLIYTPTVVKPTNNTLPTFITLITRKALKLA